MTRKVHVIASFNTDGQVQPLWLRLSLAPDAPAYRITDCKCTAAAGKYQDYSTYRCTAEAAGQRHEIGLNYYGRQCVWYMSVNNSSALAAE